MENASSEFGRSFVHFALFRPIFKTKWTRVMSIMSYNKMAQVSLS